MRQQAEELLPAGIAAIGGKAEKPLHARQEALVDAIAPDVLQIEIATARAVGIAHEGSRDRPGIESPVASVAAPRTQTQQRADEVGNAISVRAETIRTSALRANHPELFSG